MGSAVALASGAFPALLNARPAPRLSVILDNDFSGDPDGLFQLAHHLLSPTVAIPFIVGSHIHENDFLDGSTVQADNAVQRVRDLLAVLDLDSEPEVLAGRNAAPQPGAPPMATATTQRIIAEARRASPDRKLVYAAGAGLTELAEAVRVAPEVGKSIRLAWIGGMEWPDLLPEIPVRGDLEYNMTIDLAATRTIFNDSEVEIWQVPRNVYRQMLVSMPELRAQLAPAGALGAFLLEALDRVRLNFADEMGGTYILGDNPLVTLTAILSAFEPDTSSSEYVVRPTPLIGEDGLYRPSSEGRSMRVYRTIDTRLTFADMYAKFASQGEHAHWGEDI